MLRWAWRLFRRDWRQQLLVLALVAVAVAAAVAGSSVVVGAASQSRKEFGDAGALIRLNSTDSSSARTAIAAAKERFGPVEVIGHSPVGVPGSADNLDLRSQDPDGLYGRPLLALRRGRFPTKVNEIAVTVGAADLLSARIGDRVVLGGVARTVVGEVENPSDLSDDFALIRPGEQSSASSLTLLVESADARGTSAGTTRSRPTKTGFLVMVAPNDRKAVVAAVLVATTLAMAMVGLLAASGFVVVAQRRQRQLGLLAAIGATQRHLRLVMLANGAIVGAAASLGGGILGILGWIAAAPSVETAAGHRIDRLDLPWGLIGECMAIAVFMAIAAAWWPARTTARLPVMVALSRRPPRARSVHRSLLLAATLMAVGLAALLTADPTGDHVRPLVLIAGVLAVILGVVLAAPAAIRTLAFPAGRLPVAMRIALRDLVRYQARAAAALAAITLGLGISVAVVVVAKANDYRSDEGNLSNRELVIRVGDPQTAPDPALTQADRARLDAEARKIATALGDPTILTLDVAMNPSTAADSNEREPITLAQPLPPRGFRGIGLPYIATSQLLRHFGVDPATVAPSIDLLTARSGDLVLLDTSVRADSKTTVRRVDLSAYTSAPNSLITQGALRRHGWVPARAGWLVESRKALSSEQITTARARAAAAGLTIETRSGQDGLAVLRTGSTAIGALLALAIVAMTIGLIRGESAGDLRTLTATGASDRTRRTLTAGTAGALALLGVVLGTLGAYLAVAAAYASQLDRLVPLPTIDLALLAVGLPLVAAGCGWLLAGSEPESFARQTLD